jgi:hypothetical protein
MLARTGAPLADQRLIAWDAALGLDWLHLVTLLKDQQTLTLVLCHAYASLMQQPTVLLAVLGLAGLTHRLQQFALAWAIALVGTVLVFPFLPAVGGYLHHGLTPADFPFIRVPAPFMYGKVLLAARDGSMSELGILALEGIVAFPSFTPPPPSCWRGASGACACALAGTGAQRGDDRILSIHWRALHRRPDRRRGRGVGRHQDRPAVRCTRKTIFGRPPP